MGAQARGRLSARFLLEVLGTGLDIELFASALNDMVSASAHP